MHTEPHVQLSPAISPVYATGYTYTCTEDLKNKKTSFLKLP